MSSGALTPGGFFLIQVRDSFFLIQVRDSFFI